MKTTLLLPLRSLVTALAAVFFLGSCDSETTEPMPEAGPTTTSFAMVDSIKVDSYFRNSNPELFQKYQGVTYRVASQNKLEAYYVQEQNDLVLYFREVSNVKEQPWVSVTFKNRTVQNLPLSLSLKDQEMVCVQQGQSFKDGTAALSPGCVSILNGTVSLHYDPATKVINGAINDLKFGLDFFVPDYAFPNRAGNVFAASGSTRNLSITFENVKIKK